MDLARNFAYTPISPTPAPDAPTPPPTPAPDDQGPLAELPGIWKGTGFNAIWRPVHGSQDRFLELNRTNETLEFDTIPGTIPNRGLLQGDLLMTGIRYLQQITDANFGDAGLHIEPGVWLNVPATSAPNVQASVARLGSVPHGTTLLAQGIADTVAGPPTIPANNLNPFPVGNPGGAGPFAEQNLSTPTEFRTAPEGLTGIDQAMVDNPNSVLQAAMDNQTISSATLLEVSSTSDPIIGGGTTNTAFLAGDAAGPNADAIVVDATFWIETVTEPSPQLQLQYTQTVLLNFNGLSWPHITVATLIKQ